MPAIPPDVRLTTLDNGLTLILREDHSAPVVSAQAWCKAGSIDEGRWLGAGLSHVLEHMLFKGTSSRPAGRIDQEIQRVGGYMNAYTSFDRTVYWINVPNTGLTVALDILCDIMQHATLPPDELAKEMEVIRREMDMNYDDPGERSARRLFEVAYTVSPYRYAIIGYPDMFSQVQREDLLAYYREKYVPNNLFFVVVGDFQAAAVEEQIRAAFAQAKARPIPAVALPQEPPQIAPREVVEEAPIQQGYFHICWHIPHLRHPDVPVLDVLATLLGNGRSSRLFRQVREAKGLVNWVDAWTYKPGNPGLLSLSAVVDPDKFVPARDALLEEVHRISSELVSPQELEKAVKQFLAATLANRKTMQGQAQDLGGCWMVAQDLNFSARYLEAVKRITPEDLQRVARQYLTEQQRTLYALLPRGAAPKPVQVPEPAKDHPVQKVALANGLCLLLKENHRLPFVEFRMVFRGGVLAETPEDNGVTLLLARMLLQGTRSRSAAQIATDIESVGGAIDTYAGNNSFGLSAEVLRSDFELGLDLVADVLLNPAFPVDALERERAVQLAGLRALKDDLLASAFRLMRRAMFGPTGYGLHPQGNEQSVPQLTTEHLRRVHQTLVVPNNAVLAIYGDIDPAQARNAVQQRFGTWAPGPGAPISPDTKPVRPESQRPRESRDKKQAVLVMGFPGTSLHDPDRYALELIQEACSDLGSRLFLRIRDNLGLAYYVGAQNFLGLAPGYFAFYVGTAPEKVGLVEAQLLEEVQALRQEGLTEEELHRAKAKIIGHKKIARQDLGSYAMTTALDELYGLGWEHTDREDTLYQAVTIEQVKAVAQKYLRPDAMVLALISPDRAN
jgi:zinc protease